MKKILLMLLTISIALNAGLLWFFWYAEPAMNGAESSNSLYPYLSKRIFVSDNNDIILNFTQLRNQINKFTSEYSSQKTAIYFEYLPSGVSIGVNEKADFYPASLLKVPIVMGTYKKIEEHELNLGDSVTITEDLVDPAFGNLWKRGIGTKISINEAIRLSLHESDNTAKNLLLSKLDESDMSYIFDNLDLPSDANEESAIISLKNYASILRGLYLSNSLSEKNSNAILELLTSTAYNDMIPSGIPKNIKVAHKIGIALGNNGNPTVYSDCGIIYVPKRPYILCIASKETEERTQVIMQQLAQLTYNYVSDINFNTK